MKLCSAWFLYWGRTLHMSRFEILHTRLGEMLEMLDCHAIANGAEPKTEKKALSFEEAIMLR